MTSDNFLVIVYSREVFVYEIYFYKNKKGKEPVLEFIQELVSKTDKNSRINANKINDYIELLSLHGTTLGEPYIKHLEDDIWELRPLRNRIFFALFEKLGQNNSFVLLHHFLKKTQKTPRAELEQAKRNLVDLKERSIENE